ncbi:MAG: hypothetical protein ACI867_000432, partial [Glaciecola sp.]
ARTGLEVLELLMLGLGAAAAGEGLRRRSDTSVVTFA